MKRIINFLFFCFLSLSLTAEDNISLDLKGNGNGGVQTGVNRAPRRILINVIYDEESQEIRVTSQNGVTGEIFLISHDGTVVDFSPVIPYTFTQVDAEIVSSIRIEGDGWSAIGYLP